MEELQKKIEIVKAEIKVTQTKISLAEKHHAIHHELLDVYNKALTQGYDSVEVLNLIKSKMTMHANLVIQNIQ